MDPPKPTAIDMRHTKLKASEAAMLAGELVKPTWASRNEGIHERVSFEDTLWGFEMAGGAFYKTPLRVVYVRPGSRAEHACIRMGDTVLRISGRDTSELTLQEAHQLVLEAGINLKIVVTSPDDKFNAHYDYEDPVMEQSGPTAEQLKQMELERIRKALERASRCREWQFPWVKRKWLIYRESNCFMVPSKYEDKHRDQFPELSTQRYDYSFPVGKEPKNTKKNDEIPNTVNEEEDTKRITEKEEEEYEEVEEEVEEEEENVEPENETKLDQNDGEQEVNERLGDNISENQDSIEHDNENPNSSNLSTEEMENNTSESDVANIDKIIDIDSQRKDSDQGSVSNYELDNNNNHVAKQKVEENNEESLENDNKTDDKIIDEIVNNLGESQENIAKSDDEILDSVLNDNTDSDFQNER